MSFIAGSLALLATPGPTNTLLAISGAEVGWRRSIPLLAAELIGYLLAIGLLRMAVGPLVSAQPVLATALQVLVAAYLIKLAVVLWHRSALVLVQGRAVTFVQVLLTTILNPKALIFAFTLLPVEAGWPGTIGFLAGLSGLIVMVGFAWTLVGGALHRRFHDSDQTRMCYRVSAATLTLLAALVVGRSFAGG